MLVKNITINDIRSKLPQEKRRLDRDNPWLYFVMRPISFYPTWLFLKLGISANQTTYIGLIIGVIGCIFLALGSHWAPIIGVVLINIGYLFDVVDGNVARYTNSCSKYGQYIDGMATYIMVPLTFIAIGIGVFNHPDTYLNSLAHFLLGIDINVNIYLILGISGVFLSTWGFLVTSRLAAVFCVEPQDFYRPKAGSKRSLWGIVYTLGLGMLTIIRPMLLVAAIASFLSIFLFVWVLMQACYLVIVAGRALIIAKRIGDN